MEKKNKTQPTYRIRGAEIQKGVGKSYVTLKKGTPEHAAATEAILKKVGGVSKQELKKVEEQVEKVVNAVIEDHNTIKVRDFSDVGPGEIVDFASRTFRNEDFYRALEEREKGIPVYKPTISSMLRTALCNLDNLNSDVFQLTSGLREKINWTGANVNVNSKEPIDPPSEPYGLEGMMQALLSQIEIATKEVGELKDFVTENL